MRTSPDVPLRAFGPSKCQSDEGWHHPPLASDIVYIVDASAARLPAMRYNPSMTRDAHILVLDARLRQPAAV